MFDIKINYIRTFAPTNNEFKLGYFFKTNAAFNLTSRSRSELFSD